MTASSRTPTTILPHLPKSQYTLSPLLPSDLLALLAILRELYLPPIHGGFHAADVLDDMTGAEDWREEGKQKVSQVKKETRAKKRERRFSAGLVETMEGIGLGLDVPLTEATAETIVEDQYRETEDIVHDTEDEEPETPHLDPFEREWAENWLGGVVRRSQGWLEDNESEEQADEIKEIEAVLRDATAVLAMMAGTSAAGSLTRHLVFLISDSLAPSLARSTRITPNPLHSPTTTTFLASLSTSPNSPANLRQRALLPVLLHDAPMSDHESVGVQTWGSAILLGRQISLRPSDYGLFLPPDVHRGARVLELGAGTGLLSILCRKLLDLNAMTQPQGPGLVVATDFLTTVLDNLKICVDLNFPPALTCSGIEATTDVARDRGIHIAKLDWSTFPAYMASGQKEGREEMEPFVDDGPFDLVLASDCVYDETHARMLREVAGWVLRLPKDENDIGGTFHILSPLRPTFQPELESIDQHFPPLSTYTPLAERAKAASASVEVTPALCGEGLGLRRGLKLGVRGEGKRGMKGKKGEGRIDEAQGYWWWEVGWG